jgi:hypothetical protein
MSSVIPETGLIWRPEHAVEMLNELIRDNAEILGVEYVGKYDERMIPRYPSVVISAGITDKEVHATHTYAITLRCTIWVYHANATMTHQERSLEDLVLCTALVSLLEDDPTFSERIIFGFVESETPGVIAPRAGKGELIVGTRMAWEAVTQQRWD